MPKERIELPTKTSWSRIDELVTIQEKGKVTQSIMLPWGLPVHPDSPKTRN